MHFLWIGSRFPYHCRLAVESALDAMPNAAIDIHVIGERPDDPHLDATVALRRVQLRQEAPAELFGSCPGGPERYVHLLRRLTKPAAISNLARLAVLYRDGGVYLDTDVVVMTALDDPDETGAYLGLESVWARNRARVSHGLGLAGTVQAIPWALSWAGNRIGCRVTNGRLVTNHDRRAPRWSRMQANNAVIGAPARDPFVAGTLQRALLVDPSAQFALGPSLLDDMRREHPDLVRVLPPSRFYPIPPGQSYRAFEDTHIDLPPDCQVLHYVASNHRRLLRALDVDDPRFDTHDAPFWARGREVRARVAILRREHLRSV